MGRATRWLKNLFGIKKDKPQPENPNSGDRKNKNHRNSAYSAKTPTGSAPNPADPTWVKPNYYNDSDNEQNKNAIAVAAATAAAADAAVAAAQAAAAVVRLTSQGRGNAFSGSRERWASLKIQTVFRGYLSRKALRALKGLVKLQALVRGFLVRKQANATLVSMQALIRAQTSIRAQKSRAFLNNNDKSHPLFRARKSLERYDEARSEHTTSIHSRRLSGSFETGVDESPKIVEVDTGKPKSRSRRTYTWASDSTEDTDGQQTLSSPLPCRFPARVSIPECRNCYDTEWGLIRDECRFSTAQSTPRFANSIASNGPVTPAKSVCLDGLFRPYTNSPSYMANTQSFKAKLRSHSAPKQRPEAGPKKRLSLTEMMESRSSLSGVKMQRSCSQVQEVVSFKNAVMGNFNKFSDFGRTSERDCYLDGKW